MKSQKKFVISGVGCCLVDILYTNIDFNAPVFKPYISKKTGDGGLIPGQLVFAEEFEQFAGEKLPDFLKKITAGRDHDKINVGGPSIVALINAAQILKEDRYQVNFFGRLGKDSNGEYLLMKLRKTPVNLDGLQFSDLATPNTIVLSDPDYDHGTGERLFINSIGAAWDMRSDDLDDGFFDADLVVFGATALTPMIHDSLGQLLKKAKSRGCITIVNTVFDFRNEKKNPSKRWPLGENDDGYRFIDLLIMDHVEALKLSGKDNTKDAFYFFVESGCSSFIITNGSKEVHAYSYGKLFSQVDSMKLPVSLVVEEKLKSFKEGDTTGCGDNFAGGVIASLAKQIQNGKPDLLEACAWGIVSGGFSCFYIGGTYEEQQPGEKLSKLHDLYIQYLIQIGEQK